MLVKNEDICLLHGIDRTGLPWIIPFMQKNKKTITKGPHIECRQSHLGSQTQRWLKGYKWLWLSETVSVKKMLTFPKTQERIERIFIHCWASSSPDSHGKWSEKIGGIMIRIWIRGRITEIRLDILLHRAINSRFFGKANNRSRSFYLGASFDVSQANCCLEIHSGYWESGNRAKKT